MLQIMDRPGCIAVSAMKKLFEQSIQSTAVLKANTPLGEVVINGAFSHYADPNTDTMWIGFAIGMRAAERIQKNSQREGDICIAQVNESQNTTKDRPAGPV